jgi:hypothetical protein
LWLDAKEHRTVAQTGWKKPKVAYTVQEFFNSVVPEEFSGISWIKRLTRKLLLEHDWLCILLPYNPEREYRSVKWIIAMGRILNMLFIDTVLAFLFFADDGSCQLLTTKSLCLDKKALDSTDLCQWDSSTSHCSFKGGSEDFLATMILTTIITTITIPLDNFIITMVLNCKNLFVHAQGGLLKVQKIIEPKEST